MYYKLAPIAHVLSRLGFVFSLLLLAPTLVSYLYQDAAFWVFADTAAATICASGIIWLITRSHQREQAADAISLFVNRLLAAQNNSQQKNG